jgi:hypothetical protein
MRRRVLELTDEVRLCLAQRCRECGAVRADAAVLIRADEYRRLLACAAAIAALPDCVSATMEDAQ